MDRVVMIRLVAGLLFFLVFLPLYFLPAIIARRKRDATAIFWLNLLAGWTFLGWVGALIWAITNDTSPIIVQQVMPHAQLCSKCGTTPLLDHNFVLRAAKRSGLRRPRRPEVRPNPG
jgi:hypothetical protein